MASTKMPAFQFYPGDWRKDPGVQALDYHDRGVWLEILCLMHESSERGVLLLNGRPMPDEAIARVLGLDNQNLSKTLTKLEAYGVASRRQSDGALYSRRMVKDEKIRSVRQEAGKKGGNPDLLNQKSNQNPTTRVKQIPTPSSSSSSSIEEKKSACAQEIFSSPVAEAAIPTPPRPPNAPTVQQVQEFFYQRGMPQQAEPFFLHNEALGWVWGDQPIHSWQAFAQGWIKKAMKDQVKADQKTAEAEQKKRQQQIQKNGAVKTAEEILAERNARR